MSNKAFFQVNAWTFKSNMENDSLNLAESALNKLLFLTKQDFLDNEISESELVNVKITIQVEKIK